jgi:hypothetical protein
VHPRQRRIDPGQILTVDDRTLAEIGVDLHRVPPRETSNRPVELGDGRKVQGKRALQRLSHLGHGREKLPLGGTAQVMDAELVFGERVRASSFTNSEW